MGTDVQDRWMHSALGMQVGPAGARTSTTESADADGNLVLDIGGGGAGSGHANGGEAGGGGHHHQKHGGHHLAHGGKKPAQQPAEDDGEDRSVIAGKKGQYEAKVVEAAHYAMTLARGNTQKFVHVVEEACRHFSEFAAKKSEEMKGQITFGDILSSVATVVAGKIGGHLAEMVTNETGKKVAELVADKLKEKLGEVAKGAGEGAVDREEILATLKALPDAARASANDIMDAVETTIKPITDGAIEAVNNGKDLNDEQSVLIAAFYDGLTANGDKALQAYGVPNVSSGKKIGAEVLTGMIKEFEKQWIKANATLSEKIAMTRTDLDKQAQAAADVEALAYQDGKPQPEEGP